MLNSASRTFNSTVRNNSCATGASVRFLQAADNRHEMQAQSRRNRQHEIAGRTGGGNRHELLLPVRPSRAGLTATA
jgi:hypothetical protein